MAKTIQEPPVREQPVRSRPRRPPLATRALVAILAFMSLIVAAGAAYGFGFYQWANSKFHRHDYRNIGQLPCRNGCNYLLLGSDSRVGLTEGEQVMWGSESDVGGHRSDTIMLVHLDSTRKQAVILSFPRDLYVNIPHQGWDKLTSAYAGGPGRVALTLENLTGLRINGFAGVNLAGFEKVVDALGGVPICVDRPMFDELTSLNLPHAGCYDLDGFQALAFVRSRHVEGDCIPDFSRIARQQQFLRAVIAKVLSPGQIVHAASLIQAVAENLTVDNLNLADLIHLTSELKGVSTGAADFRAVPGTTATISTGQSVVKMDPEARKLFKRLRNGNPHLGDIGRTLALTPPSPAQIKIRVFDDSSGGVAQQVLDYLTTSFDVQGLSSIAGLKAKSRGAALLYKADTEPMAKVAHAFLPTLGQHEVKDAVLPDTDIAVVIPSTYHGPPITPLPTQGPSEGGTNAGC
ncbi:MAG: LCP family protein [Actinomycetota bacterium]